MGSKECLTEVNSAWLLFSNDTAWIVDFLNIMVKNIYNTKFTILIIFKYTVQWC